MARPEKPVEYTSTGEPYRGSRIRELRWEKGLSRKSMANLLGCDPDSLSKVETNGVNPSEQMLSKIAEVLEVPLAHFAQAPVHPRILRKKTAQAVGQPQLTSPIPSPSQQLPSTRSPAQTEGAVSRQILGQLQELKAEVKALREEMHEPIPSRAGLQEPRDDDPSLEKIIEYARSLVKDARYREAVDRYEEACLKAKKDRVSKERLSALYIGTIWPNYVIGHYERCISRANEVIHLNKEKGRRVIASELGLAYDWLSTIHCDFGEYKRAKRYTNQALKSGNSQINHHLSLGIIEVSLGEWKKAEDHLKSAVDMAPTGRIKAVALNGLAWLYIKQERLAEAQTCCLESYRIRREASKPEGDTDFSWVEQDSDSTRGIAFCHAFMADIYIQAKQWTLADLCVKTALNLFARIGASVNAATQNENSTIIALERDRAPEVAQRYAKEYSDYFENRSFKVERAIGKRLMGKVYAESGNDMDGRQLLGESVDELRSIGEKYELGLSLCELGLISRKLGQEPEAVEYLTEAQSIFQKLYVPGKKGLEPKVEMVRAVLVGHLP